MNTKTLERLLSLRANNQAVGDTMEAMRHRFDKLRDRHLNGTAPQAVSAFNLFQTPLDIAAIAAKALDIRPGMSLLEPSAGLGRLLDAACGYSPGRTVAVEVAKECAGELYRQERAGVKIRQRDFLALSPADLGLFDRIIMNPPFHLRADVSHILHARKFLAPSGRLVAICMATSHRKAAFADFLWEDLPSRSFKKEGTHVETALVTIDN